MDCTCEIFSHEDVSSHYVKSCYLLNLIAGQLLKSRREFSCCSLSYFTHNYLRLSLCSRKYEKTNSLTHLLNYCPRFMFTSRPGSPADRTLDKLGIVLPRIC